MSDLNISNLSPDLQEFITQNQLTDKLNAEFSNTDPETKKAAIKEILKEKLHKSDSLDSLLAKEINAGAINPLQILVLSLQYDNFKGKQAIGRISRGFVAKNMSILAIGLESNQTARAVSIMVFDGLGTKEVERADVGEIVMLAGFQEIQIGDTITTPDYAKALPRVSVDEPTIQMTFGVNTSPFAGKEGKAATSRQIRDRLYKELETDVALRVAPHPESSEKFVVSGRGELHLSVLIEKMRREGFEFEVSRPEVILKTKEQLEKLGVKV